MNSVLFRPLTPILSQFHRSQVRLISADPPIQRVIYDRFKETDTLRLYSVIDELENNGLSLKDIRLKQTANKFAASLNSGKVDVSFEEFCEMINPCLPLIAKAFQGGLIFPNFTYFKDKIGSLFRNLVPLTNGKVSEYIPELRLFTQHNWAVSFCTIDGQQESYGDFKTIFPAQSCINPIIYGHALTLLGEEQVHKFVGHEPTAFYHDKVHLGNDGLPHNPMISSGALAIASLLHPELTLADRIVSILSVFEKCSATSPLGVDIPTYLSEKNSAHRCYSLAYLMQAKKVFPADVDIPKILNLYFQMSSIQVNCEIVSRIAATIANYGVNPFTGERVFNASAVERMLSLMNSCGLYNYSSSFAFEVGIPSKSNVVGCILSVVPGKLGYCTWSPALDEKGNSVRGLGFSKQLVREFNFHTFDATDSAERDPRYASYFLPEHRVAAMLYAAKHGSVGTLQRHFFSGYSLDAVDYDNRAPLHLTAAEGHLDATQFLVEYCCVDVNVQDRWGQTPLDEATRMGFQDVTHYLQMHGALKGCEVSAS